MTIKKPLVFGPRGLEQLQSGDSLQGQIEEGISGLHFFVDQSASGSFTPDGSVLRPFPTIQEALSAIGDPSSSADQDTPYAVHIRGGTYDEDLTIPAGRILLMICDGLVILGDGLSPGTPRNITYNVNGTKEIGSARPFLGITAKDNNVNTSTNIARISGFLLSGDIVSAVESGGTASPHDLYLSNCELQGKIDNPSGSGDQTAHLHSVWLASSGVSVTGDVIIRRMEQCDADGSIDVIALTFAIFSDFVGNITVDQAPSLTPKGFFGCEFGTLTFTGAASSFLLDTASHARSSNVTLGNGNELALIEAASGIRNDSSKPGDTVKDAIDNLSSGTGLLDSLKVVSTNGTDTPGDAVLVDTSSGNIIRNLPAGSPGSVIKYKNSKGSNNVLATPDGTDPIEGTNAAMSVPPGGTLELLWFGGSVGWSIIAIG